MDKKVKGEIIKSGNIVLSGFMGSGKTTVGRRLAAALDMQFVDMDLYIEKKTGMTVKEIFAEYGELHFRALETETVKELAQSNHFVIATGGGTLMQPQNVEGFHQGGGTIYYLDVPLAALQERLKNDKRRPLLQTPDRRAVIERLLNERRPKYLASADVIVDAGAPTVVVVERICALRGEPIEKAKRKKPGNTSEKERPQKKRFRRRRRKKGTSPGTRGGMILTRRCRIDKANLQIAKQESHIGWFKLCSPFYSQDDLQSILAHDFIPCAFRRM